MERKPVHLIMVTTANNNKYYDMIPKGDTIEIRYGRVDSTCTTIIKPMKQWESIYRSKVKKGYVDKSELIADLAEKVETKVEYQPISNKVIAKIVERLQAFAKAEIDANYNIKANQVTQAMIDEADLLLKELITRKTVSKFNETLLKLFTVIPRKMAQVTDYLATTKDDFSKIFHREQDLLDIMKSQVISVSITEESEDVEYQKNCTILEYLGIEIEETKPSDVKLIKKELQDLAGKYRNSWKIKNVKTEERFQQFLKDNGLTKKHFKYLWHGTKNQNLWSILQKGLLLRPELAGISTNGKCFGLGIYSAPTAKKSYGYTTNGVWSGLLPQQQDSVFMILNRVILGNICDVHKFSSDFYDFTFDKLQNFAPHTHSLWAHKGMDTGWWELKNDEIIVYNESQITCSYLVELA